MTKAKPIQCTARSAKIQPFYVMELLEKAQALEARGEKVIHMEIGEPDFTTPLAIREAGVRAMEEGHTFYTHSLGLPQLRERISAYYAESHNLSVPAARIIVTSGTSGAFFLLCAVLLERGRNFLISDPGYPCYRNFGALFDSHVVPLPVSETSRFEITPAHLEECETSAAPAYALQPGQSHGHGVRGRISGASLRRRFEEGRGYGGGRDIFRSHL